jgi:hypothetical protein
VAFARFPGTYLPGHFFYASTDLLIAIRVAHDPLEGAQRTRRLSLCHADAGGRGARCPHPGMALSLAGFLGETQRQRRIRVSPE